MSSPKKLPFVPCSFLELRRLGTHRQTKAYCEQTTCPMLLPSRTVVRVQYLVPKVSATATQSSSPELDQVLSVAASIVCQASRLVASSFRPCRLKFIEPRHSRQAHLNQVNMKSPVRVGTFGTYNCVKGMVVRQEAKLSLG